EAGDRTARPRSPRCRSPGGTTRRRWRGDGPRPSRPREAGGSAPSAATSTGARATAPRAGHRWRGAARRRRSRSRPARGLGAWEAWNSRKRHKSHESREPARRGIRPTGPCRTRHAVDLRDLREASDAALVVAIGRWRQEALAEAYRRHAGAVFALSRRLLRDAALAEEITQEVFLRLWHAPDRFDPERGSLRSYLLAQTHGRTVDLL